MNILLIGSDKSNGVAATPGARTRRSWCASTRDEEHLHALAAPDLRVDDPRRRLRQDEHGLHLRGSRPRVVRTFSEIYRPAHQPLRGDRISAGSGTWSTSSAACTYRSTIATTTRRRARLQVDQLSGRVPAPRRPRTRSTSCATATTRPATSRACSAQQLFLKEMQRQSGRWSEDWDKVVELIKAVTAETTSDIDSLKRLQPLVELIFEVDTSKINTVHLEGATPHDRRRVVRGRHPGRDRRAPWTTSRIRCRHRCAQSGASITQEDVHGARSYNGSGIAGLSTTAVNQLVALGYTAEVGAGRPRVPRHHHDRVRAQDLSAPAKTRGRACSARRRVELCRPLPRRHRRHQRLRRRRRSTARWPCRSRRAGARSRCWRRTCSYDAASLEGARPADSAPTSRCPRPGRPASAYDEFRNVRRPEPGGQAHAGGGRRGEDARRAATGASRPCAGWTRRPSRTPVTSQDDQGPGATCCSTRVTTCTWSPGSSNGTLYWVLNTLDNELSNDVMLGLATSFKPVK